MVIYIKNKLCIKEIVSLLLKTFEVEEKEILVKNNAYYVKISDMVEIVCEPYYTEGDFKTRLDIDASEKYWKEQDNLKIIGKMCEILGCGILVDDYSKNPFRYLKIEGVSMDIDKLDDVREVYDK